MGRAIWKRWSETLLLGMPGPACRPKSRQATTISLALTLSARRLHHGHGRGHCCWRVPQRVEIVRLDAQHRRHLSENGCEIGLMAA